VRQFALVTYWHLDAPIDRVWEAIVAVEEWPRWWRYVHRVEGNGQRRCRRLRRAATLHLVEQAAVSTFLCHARDPRRAPFVARRRCEGDLTGTGRWHLAAEGGTTRVRYDWTVVTTKPWMNVLAPLLQPAFRWNHNEVMAEGGRGLARHLGVSLISHRGSPAAG
jgi:hypothetical protein